MDKKNKIYLAIIGVCVIGMIAVWFLSRTPAAPVVAPLETIGGGGVVNPIVNEEPTALVPLPDKKIEYNTPRVFPQDTNLDLEVFEDDDFESLVDYVPLTVSPEEIGKENPFLE